MFREGPPELSWVERSLIFFFLLVIILISSLGNTFVLYMSKELKSVTKDSKGSTLLINIAFVDLMFNPFITFGMLVSVITRDWRLGSAYCFLAAWCELYLALLEIFFICVISLHRTIVIKFPLTQHLLINTRRLYIVITSGYVLCTVPVILRTVSTTQIIGYIPEEFHCDTIEVATVQPWKSMLIVCIILFALIPISVTVLLYVYMMVFAMSKVDKLNRTGMHIGRPYKAIRTVSIIVGSYLLSVSLSVALIAVRIRVRNIPPRFLTAGVLTYLINTAVNPIIYGFTNPMFRQHLKRLILRQKRAREAQSSMKSSAYRTRNSRTTTIVTPVLHRKDGGEHRPSTPVSFVQENRTPSPARVIREVDCVIENPAAVTK